MSRRLQARCAPAYERLSVEVILEDLVQPGREHERAEGFVVIHQLRVEPLREQSRQRVGIQAQVERAAAEALQRADRMLRGNHAPLQSTLGDDLLRGRMACTLTRGVWTPDRNCGPRRPAVR